MNYKLSNISYQLSILLVAIFFASPLRGQVVIGNNGATPRPFSLLEMDTTNYKGGLRLPQLTTTEREAIDLASGPGAAHGLVIYNISNDCVEFWDGDQWESLCDATASFIYFTQSGDSRILRDIADPFPADGSETRSLIPHDTPECTTGTPPYTVTVRFGGDYAHINSVVPATGAFNLKLDPNLSDRMRFAIIRVTDNCSSKYEDFLVIQNGTTCVPPRIKTVGDVTQTITQGSSVTMGAVADTGTEPLTYQWYWWTSDNVSSALPIGGAQDSIFSTTLSTAGTYYFWCKVSNSCDEAVSATFTVTVSCVPAQPGEIIGKPFPQQGATGVTYSVINVPGVGYKWSLPSDWTQTAGGNSNSITVTVGSRNGTVIVTPSNSCGTGTAQTLGVKVIKPCGAYIAAGVWREFMCWNLGANEDADPFAPSADLNGDYYQWGYRYPSGTRDAIIGTPTSAGDKIYPLDRAWNSATPTPGFYGNNVAGAVTTDKSATDPCPDGFRVPNKDEWTSVMNTTLNPRKNSTGWTSNLNCTDCWSGSMFGDSLFLPATGYRDNSGSLFYRGYYGYYWSSTENSSTNASFNVDFNSSGSYVVSTGNRAFGYSIRCIKDVDEIAGPKYISIPRTTVPQTYSVDVPGATSYDWHVPFGWTINSNDGNGTITLFPGTAIEPGGMIFVVVTMDNGSKLTYIKDIKACGALTRDGFKNLMCHNLGADETADPFEPSAALNGDYWQWGYKYPSGYRDDIPAPGTPTTADGSTLGVWSNSNATPGVYGNGVIGDESSTEKSATDPCPVGYRIPNSDEWHNGGISFLSYNKWTTKAAAGSTWTSDPSNWTGMMFGDALFLPTAGKRLQYQSGLLNHRGNYGHYWLSSLWSEYSAYGMLFYSTNTGTEMTSRADGLSIRCIAE